MATHSTLKKDGIFINAKLVVDEDDWGEKGYSTNFAYNFEIEEVDSENNIGKVWVWITDSDEIANLKSHSDYISTIEE